MPPIKPGRWTANPADVDPLYLDLWRGLRFALPGWGSSDTDFDIAAKTSRTVVGGVPAVGPLGPVIDFSAGRINLGTHDFASTGFTVAALIKWDNDSADAGIFGIGTQPGDADGHAQFWRDENGGSDRIGIALYESGFTVHYGAAGELDTTDYHLYTWAHNGSDNSNRVYLDAVEIISQTTNLPNVSEIYRFAATNGDAVKQADAKFAVAFMWDRALSASNIRLLTQDPFGLIRRYDAQPTDDIFAFFDVTDMPADFGTADGASGIFRVRGVDLTSSPLSLHVRIFRSDEATPLSAEAEVIELSDVDGEEWVNYLVPTFADLDTLADKVIWDAAKVRLRWSGN